MSAGTTGKAAHAEAARRLEVAANIKQATAMLTGISDQKDKLDGKYREISVALNKIRNRPDIPVPQVTVDSGAKDFADQMDKAAAEELKASKEEERLAAELEAVGDAKDMLDQQHASLLNKIAELRSAFGNQEGAPA